MILSLPNQKKKKNDILTTYFIFLIIKINNYVNY